MFYCKEGYDEYTIVLTKVEPIYGIEVIQVLILLSTNAEMKW